MPDFATSALATLAVLSAVISAISLMAVMKLRQQPLPTEVLKMVHTLASDVQDLYDRVDHWQRRDRVRNLREKAPPTIQVVEPPPGSPAYKQALRELVRARNNGGNA